MTDHKKKETRPGKRGRLRILTGLLGGLLGLWGLLPLFDGIFGVGVVVPLLVSTAALYWGFWAPLPAGRAKGGGRVLQITILAVIGVTAALALVISGLMIGFSMRRASGESTVIVLGSRIYGDQPSRMLRQRLDAALAYLEQNPEANCVVSGGWGKGETYTEAYVMRKYLMEHGIAPSRVAMEGKSTDTHENIGFSMALIREKGWSESVVIATQVFHQYRAGTLAKWAGAAGVAAAPCRTPLHLTLNYWVRECAAICRLWILRY